MKEPIKKDMKLIEISSVKVEQDLPKLEKIVEYVRQLNGNPNHYICGKFKITAIHPDSGPSLEDCLQGMMA